MQSESSLYLSKNSFFENFVCFIFINLPRRFEGDVKRNVMQP